MFDGRWRSETDQIFRPIGISLRRAGVAADHLTLAGLVLSAAAAVLVAAGELRWGVLVLTLGALTDVLDGAVAKASGTAGPRGAFFDSVADRVSDALLLGGVAWHLSVTDGGQIVILPFAVMAASLIISYERAKAESLGFTAKGGLMERLERIVILGVGLFFEVLLVPLLWVMLVLSLVTVVQRFLRVWAQATAAAEPLAELGRWQVWRGRRIARSSASTLRRRRSRHRR